MKTGWNLLTGTLTRYVLLFVNIAVGIFLMPFTVQHLGKAEYGLWMLTASLTAYLQLLDLGYGNGLVRQVTHADAIGDEQEMNVILSTFAVVYTAIGVAALLIVSGLAAFALPRFPNLTPEDVRTAQIVLLVLGVRIAVGFPMGVFGAVTTARQRFAATSGIAIAVTLLQAAATYWVLRTGHGLVPLVSATTLIGLASYVAYAAVAKSAFPGMRLSPALFSRKQVREVTAYSMYLFMIALAIQFGYNIDNIVIAAVAGTSAVAVYSVAFRLADYQRQLCNQFNGLLFPIVVRFSAADEMAAMRATLIDGTRFALGLITGVTICLFAVADRLMVIWMGPDFSGALPPLYVLGLAGVVLVGAGPLGNLLLARGRHRLVAYACAGEALANLLLTLLLVRSYGIVGAAIGTAVSVTVSNVFVQMPAACRLLDVPVIRFLAQVAGPSILATIPSVAAAWLVRAASPGASLAHVIGIGIVVASVYLTAFVALGLSRPERVRYVGSIRELTTAFRTS